MVNFLGKGLLVDLMSEKGYYLYVGEGLLINLIFMREGDLLVEALR